MIVISLDPSINPKSFGVALLDTSISNDLYKCIVRVEQPEEYRKRVKIKLPSKDPSGLQRGLFLARWARMLSGFIEKRFGIEERLVLTELSVGKPVWSKDPVAKAGRAKSKELTNRAGDSVTSILYIVGEANIIEVDPADFKKKKVDRSQILDMMLGPDRDPRNEHYDDSLYRVLTWAQDQKIRGNLKEAK